MGLETKNCCGCGVQPHTNFHRNTSTFDGLQTICKTCTLEKNRKRRKLKSESTKEERKQRQIEKHNSIINRKEKICSGKCNSIKPLEDYYKSKYSLDGHLGKCIVCVKEEHNTNEYRAQRRKYREKSQNKTNATQRAWYAKSVENNPVLRLRKATSKAVYVALKRNTGSKHGESVFKYLPYTTEELKKHLELLWEPWMSWDNYGSSDVKRLTWQIDHIIPQSSLPFSDMADDNFQKLWALENLRPLETMANIRKSNKAA